MQKLAKVLVGFVVLVVAFQSVPQQPTQAVPLESFDVSGAAAIRIRHCYDTNPANRPVVLSGEIVCNPSNPTILSLNTTYTEWIVLDIPTGNRLSGQMVSFLPMGANEWTRASVACVPDGNNRCTSGSAVGSVTGVRDFLCDASFDVLAAGGPGGLPLAWPDSSLWTPPTLTRLAASILEGGGGEIAAGDPDGFVHDVQPFPAPWQFKTLETAPVTFMYLGGTIGFTLPAWRADAATYISSYPNQAGLTATSLSLGESMGLAPGDESRCNATPQDTIWERSGLTTPATDTIIPRWTIIESEPDLGDGTVTRIFAWQCDRIGLSAPVDTDGDCDPDLGDPNDFDWDVDDELAPDGIERHLGSFIAIPDSDGDGVTDADEIAQFTDPLDSDTDDDGQADKQDNIPTNGPNVPSGNNLSVAQLNPETGYDASDLTEDNCPAEYNPTQLNTDALWQYHGMGGNLDPDGTGSFLGQNSSTGDRTNPAEDKYGDACDFDDDNDGLIDAVEPLIRIRPWSGPTDPGGPCVPEPSCSSSGDEADSTVCVTSTVYPAAAAPLRTISPLLGDVDFDLVLDGRECSFRSRPDASCRTATADALCVVTPEALNCTTGVIAPAAQGCAQPAANGTTPGGGDVDADLLYLPGSAGNHDSWEKFWRKGLFVLLDDIDGDGIGGSADSDADRDTVGTVGTASIIRDGWEVRFYGTHPTRRDSDFDGCLDGDEITDINGDGAQNAGDSGLRAQAAFSYDASPANGRIDREVPSAQGVSRYALAANRDFNKDGVGNAADGGILAAAIAAVGGCLPYIETGLGPNMLPYP